MSRRGDYESAIKPYKGTIASHKLEWKNAATATSSAHKINVNINGTEFMLSRSTCLKIPLLQSMLSRSGSRPNRSMLASHFKSSEKGAVELSFEKSPAVFSVVVDYVQNHELHAPRTVCPKIFARELKFWGFNVDELEPCCFAGVLRFLYEQEKLEEFHGFLKRKSTHKMYDCDESSSSVPSTSGLKTFTSWQTFKPFLWDILDRPFRTTAGKIYFCITVFSILGSFVTASAETVEYFQRPSSQNGTALARSLTIFFIDLDYACISIQSLDYLLRVVLYPYHLSRFGHEFINVSDGVAFVATLVKLAIPNLVNCDPQYFLDHGCEESVTFYLYIIYSLQLLRIIRILRPLSLTMQFRLLYYTLKSSLSELLLVFMLLLLLAMIFSSMLYYLGRQGNINSIPIAMWYSLITLTTVGYGDVVPDDWISMVLGSGMAVLGVIMLTMTTPIMVSNFHSLYINAVVGEPATIKNLHKMLDKDAHPSSSSSSLINEPAGSQDEEEVRDKTLSTGSAKKSFRQWCRRCCPCPGKKQVFPQEAKREEEKERKVSEEEKFPFAYCRRRREPLIGRERERTFAPPMIRVDRFSVGVEGSVELCKPSDSTEEGQQSLTDSEKASQSGDEFADVDSVSANFDDQYGHTDSDAFGKTVFDKHLSMIQPRRRSWYGNYDTLSTSESETSSKASLFAAPVDIVHPTLSCVQEMSVGMENSGSVIGLVQHVPRRVRVQRSRAPGEDKGTQTSANLVRVDEATQTIAVRRHRDQITSVERGVPDDRNTDHHCYVPRDTNTDVHSFVYNDRNANAHRCVSRGRNANAHRYVSRDRNANAPKRASHHHVSISETQPQSASFPTSCVSPPAAHSVATSPRKECSMRKPPAFPRLSSLFGSSRAFARHSKVLTRLSTQTSSTFASSRAHSSFSSEIESKSSHKLNRQKTSCCLSVKSNLADEAHGSEAHEDHPRVSLRRSRLPSSGTIQRQNKRDAKVHWGKKTQR